MFSIWTALNSTDLNSTGLEFDTLDSAINAAIRFEFDARSDFYPLSRISVLDSNNAIRFETTAI